jgi:short-subunit dehydrogenase involved in D-alanine esterification of teichoic acids
MKTIVITGSTRGIGLGLAEALLTLGCQVVISGRQQETIDMVVAELSKKYGVERMYSFPSDVRDHEAVKALWKATMEHSFLVPSGRVW